MKECSKLLIEIISLFEEYEFEYAITENGDDRIFARYNNEEGDVYIITEWDRSVTTILFPSEY